MFMLQRYQKRSCVHIYIQMDQFFLKYLIHDCLLVSPILSSDFQEIVVSELHSDYQLHDVNFIACKAIRFPITNPKNGQYYVAPLLMS